MKNLLIIFSIFVTVFGCGKKTTEEKRDQAIISAKILLSSNECQKAIDLLEGVGRDHYHAEYLQTLSSAYACRAGFSEIKLFSSDFTFLTDGSSTSLLGGLSRFSTSSITGFADSKFLDLQKAIDLLLYSGGVSIPSHASRSQKFSSRDLSNMNIQGIFMLMAQLGRFSNYLGNPNTNGLKGSGALTNQCFYAYVDATAQNTITALNTNPLNNTCDNGDLGHTEIAGATAQTISRMCRGVILMNNLMDLTENTVLNLGSSNSSIQTYIDALNSYINNSSCNVTALGVNLGAMCAIKDLETCEQTATISELEIYFSAVYEALML